MNIWDYEEISTRNCTNAKVAGKRVYCKMNHPLVPNKGNLSANLAYTLHGDLLNACKGCLDFEHDKEAL